MYISKISLRNFGPFPTADFEFSGHEVNVVIGENATGKTQLYGAIIASIVGRPALQIVEGGIGPSEISLTLTDGTSTEVTSLSVRADERSKVIVSHVPSSLAMRILGAMSNQNGPQLTLAEASALRSLPTVEWRKVDNYFREAGIKFDAYWQWRQVHGKDSPFIGSRGEHELASLLKEFAVRRRSEVALPFVIDEIGTHWDDTTRQLACEVLKEIAKFSQVIVFSIPRYSYVNNTRLVLPRIRTKSTSLAYYNNRIFSPQYNGPHQQKSHKWKIGAKFPFQENRSYEFKEIKGTHPISSIKSLVDQYVVAFMNAGAPQSGSIFWGIRDEDRSIIGVRLTERECDELRRIVTEKLHQIIPAIAPTAYQIELHQVSDGKKAITDLYVVEVKIPAVRRTLLFATGSQDVYVKTDAGKRKLTAIEIQQELLRRVGVDPTF